MKGNLTSLSRYSGTAFVEVTKRLSIKGPSRTRETIEQELVLDSDVGNSSTKKKAPGTFGIGDIEIEVVWNPSAPSGTLQLITATGAGTVTGAGNALVTLTGAALTGGFVALNIPVTAGAPSVWVPLIITALQANASVVNAYNVSGAGASITIQSKLPRANDATLNLAIATGTATGITAAPTSTQTTAGVAGTANSENHHLFVNDFNTSTAATWMIEYPNGNGLLVHGTIKELSAVEAAPNSTIKRSFTIEPTGEFYRDSNSARTEIIPTAYAVPTAQWAS